MDVESAGSHAHLLVPSFHSSFLLPYRVLFLVALGLFLWTTNLHLLHHLGVDIGFILAIKSPSSASSEALTTGRPVLPDDELDNEDDETGEELEAGLLATEGGAGFARAGEIIRPLWGLSAVFLGWSLGGWALFAWATTRSDQADIDSWRALPFITGLGVVVGLGMPYGGVWRRERMAFLRSIRRTIFSPLNEPIYFSDVLCADVLTSFAKVFGDLWVSICIILEGDLSASQLEGAGGSLGAYFIPFITSIPYMIRLRQCLVEYIASDYKNSRQLANAFKYATAFPVILFSAVQKTVMEDIAAERGVKDVDDLNGPRWFGEHPLFRLWLLSVFVNSLYSFWWDVTNDWGLTILCPSEWSSTPKRTSLSKQPSTSSGLKYLPGANPTNTSHAYPPRSDVHKRTLSISHHHRHPSLPPSAYSLSSSFSGAPDGIHPFGLRKEMHFPDPAVYYLAIAIDLVLRFTWSLKLSSHLHSISEIESGVFLMEGLELGRRWMWVFLRIEWEEIKRARESQQRRMGFLNSSTVSPSHTHRLSFANGPMDEMEEEEELPLRSTDGLGYQGPAVWDLLADPKKTSLGGGRAEAIP